MDLGLLRQHFGPHALPQLLEDLLVFASAHPGKVYSAGFELQDFSGQDVAEVLVGTMTPGVAAVGDELRGALALFGHDDRGALYGLWYYEDQLADEAPVVFIGGRDGTNVVMAHDFSEFIALLMVDRPDLGVFAGEDHSQLAHSEAHQMLKNWASMRGIVGTPNPRELARVAEAKHPAFDEWMAEIYAQADHSR